jgi:hypothetical protein
MSEHSTPKPAATGGHPTDPDLTAIDLVAGDPPVPITIWRTARSGDDQHTTVSARLAYRLIAAYSRPGEAVVDLTDDHALAGVCATGGRRHHRSWFTDSSSLIIGPATPPRVLHRGGGDEPDPGAGDGGEPSELAAWFGDDLTDPDLLPPGGPVTALPEDGSLEGATSLVVACWPLDAANSANRVRLAWVLAACARLLRPGGCLVLVVGVPTGMTATPEDFGPLVAAASSVGLGYLQHIVAVAADADGDQFIYHVTDEELLALAHAGGQQWTVAHLRVHADLMVFSQARPQTPKGTGKGGRRRG